LRAEHANPDNSKAFFTYDRDGNTIRMSNNNSTTTFSYDARNRETSETWTISGIAYTLKYSYDRAGNLATFTNPDNTIASYSFDPLNRITSVKNGSTTLASFAYAPNGKLNTVTYGNNVVTSYSYDKRGRPTRIKDVKSSTSLLDLTYTYDDTENILRITSPLSGNESYSFDYPNRLANSTGSWGTTLYGYDKVGNRAWAKQSGTNSTYNYVGFNELGSIGSSPTYSYDNNGNLKTQTAGTVTSYSYDYENRLTRVTQGSTTLGAYAYSPAGGKIISIESGATTVTLSLGVNVVYEKQLSSGTISDYVFGNGMLLAKLSSSTTYYQQDHLGSTRGH